MTTGADSGAATSEPVEVGSFLRRLRSAWHRSHLFLGHSRWAFVGLGLASALAGLVEAAILALVAQAATLLTAGGATVATELGPFRLTDDVAPLLAVAGGLAVARLGLLLITAHLPARLTADALVRGRTEVFEAFTEASWEVQSRDRDGHLQEIVTQEAGHASLIAAQLAQALAAGLTFTALVASALVISPLVAAIIVVTALVLFLALRPLSLRSRRYAHLNAYANIDYATTVSESIRMAEEMHVFGAASEHRRQVRERLAEIRRLFYRVHLLGRLVPAAYQSLAIGLVIGGLVVVHLLDAGGLAALGAVVLMLVRSLTYGQQLQSAHQRLNELMPFVDHVTSTAERYRRNPSTDGDHDFGGLGTIEFRDVSYHYRAGESVLHELSFEVGAGEAIGVVGPSGAGKSTLVQLLLRLRRPTDGTVLIDGSEADSFTASSWQATVAYVPQTPNLLDGTVAENIRYFRDLDDDAVERAARLAHIHDDIVRWPGGYERPIGQRVDAVSGGQRQRLCLARALAGAPSLLILDEPTSALDAESEALLQRSLEELKGGITMFIVAHRISTLALCDRVMVLEDGRLVAFDEPARLEAGNRFYRRAVELSTVVPRT